MKKLNSNRGASMMLALALFLVCTMVSSVVIVAATSGASRNIERVDKQRAYLAVSSASQLLAKELENVGQFVGTFETQVFGCTDYQNTVTKRYFDTTVTGYEYQEGLIPNAMDPIIVDSMHSNVRNVTVDEDKTTVDGLLGELIIKAAGNVYLNKSAYTETFQIALSENDERLPEVDCKFTMDSEYNISIEITTDQSDYAIVVSLDRVDIQDTITNISPFGCEHEVYYKELQSSGVYADKRTTVSIPGTSEVVYTTITWGEPEITKGVGLK